MYQALYRKYRPSTFENVVGQKVVLKTILNSLNNDRLSHAYIFSGPRGTGKTSIAKLLAKAVNCQDISSVICDKCVSCTQINEKQSTDIIEIDAASNNGIDEIREIRNKVNLVPSVGKYKIYIVDEVHMLTTGAFNALLKTLEEPPAHAIFILATTEPHKIPSTILSRCQKFEFKKISDQDMCERIKEIIKVENIKIEEEAINEIVRLSDGGLRDCISLLDQINCYSNDYITLDDVHEVNGSINYKTVLNFINYIFSKDLVNILKTLDYFYQSGKNIVKVAEEVVLYLRNILISNIDKNLLDNSNIYIKYSDLSNDDVMNLIDIINININSIKESSDPKLALEILLLKYCNDIKGQYSFESEEYTMKKNEETNVDGQILLSGQKISAEVVDVKEDDQKDNFEHIDNKVQVNENKENSTTTIDDDNFASNSNFLEHNDDETTNEKNEVENTIENNSEEKNTDSNSEQQTVEDNNENDEECIEKTSDTKSDSCLESNLNSFEEILEQIKEIRISNTLCNFNKQFFLGFKSRINEFKNYATDINYSFVADMVLDGELKAASQEYLIFVYDTILSSEMFNKNISLIEELVEKIYNRKFKVISTDLISWDIIKKEFNDKTRVFEFTEENEVLIEKLNNLINKEKNDLDSVYGSLVEYEEEN